MAYPRHEAVRTRYEFRCGYCGVSELVYACARCNLYKADTFPDAAHRAAGRRILHPLRDDLSAHLREDPESGRLEAITDTGRFHIHTLRLNRPPLIHQRLRRRLENLRALRQELLEMEVAQLRRTVTSLRATLGLLPAPNDLNPDQSQ